jgi:5'-nucleotidase
MARRALISNDDGIHSPGLAALERAAQAAGLETLVVAPDREQSASSHALTLHRPLRVVKTGEKSWVVDGTPTDCVNLALCSILKETPPDVVLSGVNSGPNLGDDVTYSGTVAAAFEGTLLGVPSIAFSLDYRRDRADTPPDYTEAETVAREVILFALEAGLPGTTLWNVNIPGGRPRGFRATHMGRRRYGESVVEKIDPRGRPYFWIGGVHVDTHEDGSDLTAVADGYVSVTPLHLDLTAYQQLPALGKLAARPLPLSPASHQPAPGDKIAR